MCLILDYRLIFLRKYWPTRAIFFPICQQSAVLSLFQFCRTRSRRRQTDTKLCTGRLSLPLIRNTSSSSVDRRAVDCKSSPTGSVRRSAIDVIIWALLCGRLLHAQNTKKELGKWDTKEINRTWLKSNLCSPGSIHLVVLFSFSDNFFKALVSKKRLLWNRFFDSLSTILLSKI